MIPHGSSQQIGGRPGLPPRAWAVAVIGCLVVFSVCWQVRRPYDDRVAVVGTVRFRGKPLAKGIIRYLPQEPGLAPAGAVISHGRYRIRSDNGLMPGLYAIMITAAGPSSAGNVDSPESWRMTEMIPSDYNRRTNLFRSVQRGRNNVIDFDLSAPPTAE